MSNLFHILRSGDIEAFERLYTENYALVRDYLVRWDNICYEDAEEIAQDVMVVLWENQGKFYGEDNNQLLRYIYVTANRIAIKLKKAKQKRFELHAALEYDPDIFSESPEEIVISEQILSKIDAAILSMPSVRREVYKLKYSEDCSNKEIADRLKIDVATVRWHIHTLKTEVDSIIESQ